jgi:glutamate dehydrogenase (NADP+)
MSQNNIGMYWTREKVNERLHTIMQDIHAQCLQYGTDENGVVDYVKGANIAGFVKVADAMIDQGVV